MAATFGKAFGVVGPNSTVFTLALDSGAGDIPVGDVVVVAALRSIVGTAVGLSNLTDTDGNTWTRNQAQSIRAATHDLSLHFATVTNAIEDGDDLSLTFRADSNRRLATAATFSGLTGVKDANSLATGADGAVSSGPNGSGNPVTTSLTVAADTLVIAALASGTAGNTFTPTAAQNWISTPKQGTAYGSAERNVQLFYKQVTAAGSVSFGGNLTTSGSWTAAMLSLVVAPVTPPTGGGGSVVVGGVKKAVAARSVVVGGVKKPVVGTWVVVGGVKKPTGLNEWDWWLLLLGFCLGLVVGLCLGIVAVIIGEAGGKDGD